MSSAMTRFLRGVGGRCAARPLVVVAIWVAVAVGATVASYAAGGRYSVSASLPGTEVQQADQDLARHLPSASAESADVLLRGRTAAAVRAAVPVVAARIARLPQVAAA